MAQNSILKIAVVGAESTGKTWLCEALAKHYQTVWVPEYARAYFNDSDIYNYTLTDLEIIAKKQIELENEKALLATKFLFCDTTLITLKIWAELEFYKCPDSILNLLKQTPYNYYFITNNDVPWQEDPIRQNKHSRELLFQMNESEVKKSGVPYTVISGINSDRLSQAIKTIDTFFNHKLYT